MELPAEITALVADAAGPDEKTALANLRVAKLPMPRPGKGQVIVKIEAAPCNPADLYYITGRYGIDRPLPATPGFEGAGTVVASGGGLLGRWLKGKRVACGGHESSGCWADYCLVDAAACLPLHKDLTFEQGAAALANPVTALALADLVARRHRAYIQTGAAGQLGKMILVELARRGIEGIHIVRRAEQAAALKTLGAKHVVVSSGPDFERELARLAHELDATIALDAVAGDLTGQLVTAMPKTGQVVVYGALSGDPCGRIDPMKLAFGHKVVRGFEVAAVLEELGLFRSFRLATKAQQRVRRGDFTTQIRGRVPLVEAPAKLAAYVENMSEGKLLLVPG